MEKEPVSGGKVSMRQIADVAGLSVMSVSRALKNSPRQSRATRERVHQIARELGYQTHPYVSALMSNLARTRPVRATANLAIVHFSLFEETEVHPYYLGALARARELGYQAEPIRFDPKTVPSERLRKILLARGIRGIVLMPAEEGFASIDFNFDGFAVAALGHTIDNPPLPRVASDIWTYTFRAFDEMIRRGYRRIGLITTRHVNELARFLYSGALLAYRNNLAPGVHLVEKRVEEPVHSSASLRKLKNWILRERLDAVTSPIFGFPLYEMLQHQGFAIPGQLGYLHLLNYPNPQVSCQMQAAHFMGMKAVDIVVAAINRNEFRPSEYPYIISTPELWHEGTTLPSKITSGAGNLQTPDPEVK